MKQACFQFEKILNMTQIRSNLCSIGDLQPPKLIMFGLLFIIYYLAQSLNLVNFLAMLIQAMINTSIHSPSNHQRQLIIGNIANSFITLRMVSCRDNDTLMPILPSYELPQQGTRNKQKESADECKINGIGANLKI